MKLTEFIIQMNTIVAPTHGAVKFEVICTHSNVVLEVSIKSRDDDPFNENETYKFIAIISIEERYGIKEMNINNVPEAIRTNVFDTVMTFASTSLDRRF